MQPLGDILVEATHTQFANNIQRELTTGTYTNGEAVEYHRYLHHNGLVGEDLLGSPRAEYGPIRVEL